MPLHWLSPILSQLEKAYFTFSLLPAFDESGKVIGILNPAIETACQVLTGRRQQFQLQLADRIRPLANPDEVIAVASELLGEHLGVARVVYAESDSADAVLIAVTGYGQGNDRKQTSAAGFDHHFVKPVDTRKRAAILAEIGTS